MEPTLLYNHLGKLLEYPGSEYANRINRACELLHDVPDGDSLQASAQSLNAFADAVRGLADSSIEELYTRTFDLNPLCSLNMGWHLYGENYTRGSFLVSVREALRAYGIVEGTELPDHLSYILPLLAKMDRKEADELVKTAVLPGLAKMEEGFNKEAGNPFSHLLIGVRHVLHAFHPSEVGEYEHG